uniref:Uncharacterized protein n=1 Tax=Opuntia streptacantha TaxID=393608 RepID=A0A7C9EXW7_OPUST
MQMIQRRMPPKKSDSKLDCLVHPTVHMMIGFESNLNDCASFCMDYEDVFPWRECREFLDFVEAVNEWLHNVKLLYPTHCLYSVSYDDFLTSCRVFLAFDSFSAGLDPFCCGPGGGPSTRLPLKRVRKD